MPKFSENLPDMLALKPYQDYLDISSCLFMERYYFYGLFLSILLIIIIIVFLQAVKTVLSFFKLFFLQKLQSGKIETYKVGFSSLADSLLCIDICKVT